MAATVAFYRLLELDVPNPFDWPPGSEAQHIDFRDDGDGYLAFDNHPMARIWKPPFDADRSEGRLVVGLLVQNRDDVDRLYEVVRRAGHPVGQEPTTPSSVPAMRSSSIRMATTSA